MISLHVSVFKFISSQIWFTRYLPPLLSKSVLMQHISFVEASPQNGVEACYLTVSKLMVSPIFSTIFKRSSAYLFPNLVCRGVPSVTTLWILLFCQRYDHTCHMGAVVDFKTIDWSNAMAQPDINSFEIKFHMTRSAPTEGDLIRLEYLPTINYNYCR